ncbi:MAG: phage terminase large subunit, partial [Candidatus Sumerlaeota bacterium]|nr:phage terminase large subunit [Candidatus Sumerlaeota bacterium]
QIDAFSAGSEARGLSAGEWRPTKVLLDDAEDSEQVENADLRERLYDWFREVVENLGDRYTDVEVVGTILHPDSLLTRLLERPDFESKRWPSVLKFAERSDLWDEGRTRYADLANPRRTASARRFFNDRRDEMLRGAEVLWPEKEDYYDLMVQLAARGRRAFFKEKQNEPLRADSAIFDPSTFRFFRREGGRLVEEGRSEGMAIADLRVVGFLDLAMGQGARRGEGDFAAIATVGVDRSGRLYALDVWLERATPSEQARRVFAQHDLWNYTVFGIEAVGFQGLIREPLEAIRRERRARGASAADLALRELTPRGSKVERVASLEPLIHNGWLVFDRALPEEFFAQLEQFPRGRHDDGPDALASAVDLARHGDGRPQLLRKTRSGTKTGGF